MKYDPSIHHRRSIRLRGCDYSHAGAYFLTMCTQNREYLFGEIVNGAMGLNDAGWMVQTIWDELPLRFANMECDEFVVMPNHIHGIFVLYGSTDHREMGVHNAMMGVHNATPGDHNTMMGDHRTKGDHKDRPYGGGTLPGTVGRIVQAFKSITTHEYAGGVKQNGWMPFPGKLWQRNFWEHIVRDEPELNRIRDYIRNNPAQWELDTLSKGEPCVRP